MIQTRYLQENDYNTLVKWWKENRFPVPPRDFLPNNGLDGIIVSIDGRDICAGFIYDTSAKSLAWIEYIVCDFQVKDKDTRYKALTFLIKNLIGICDKMGKKYIYTSLKNHGLIHKFKDCGFIEGSKNTTEMVFIL